ncbi:MAG: hypothetical protein V1913_12225 [Fibrobacterota bacterium]
MVRKMIVRVLFFLALLAGVASAQLNVTPPSNDSVIIGDSVEINFGVMNNDHNPASTSFSVTGLSTGWTAVVVSPSSPTVIGMYSSIQVTVRVRASASVSAGAITPVTLNAVSGGTFTGTANVKALKGNQDIYFAPLAAVASNDPPFKLSGYASSGLTVSYASSNTGVATVSHDTVTIHGPGKTAITASQAGNTDFYAATSVVETLTVGKASQIITFGALPSKSSSDLPFKLTGAASSGLTVAYTSSNPTVASISNDTVTLHFAGTITITARQAGDATWAAADSVPQSLTVTGTPQTITFGALADKTYGDAPFKLSGSASSALPVSYSSSVTTVATISNDTVTIVGGGATVITASQSGDAYWSAATNVPQTLTVNKATQTITFGALANLTYGGPTSALTATASSNLTVSYTSSDTNIAKVSGSVLTIMGAGSATITALQAGNANYNAATAVPQALTIIKADQTITFDLLGSHGYSLVPFALGASSTSGLPISYVSSDPAVATVTAGMVTTRALGTTQITAKQDGNANYNPAEDVSHSLTVVRGTQTLTFDSIPAKLFNSAPFTLTATSTSGLSISFGIVNQAVATLADSTTVDILAVGTTTIVAMQAGNTLFYPATDAYRTLTVTKADQAITFNALPAKTFGDAPFALAATASSDLAVSYVSSNTDVATVSGSTVTVKTAGTTLITASQPGDANYNAAPDANQTLTVNKAAQTLTFATLADKLPTDPPFKLTGTASSGLKVTYGTSDPGVATVSNDTVTLVAKGNVTITAYQNGNDTFYAAPNVARTFRVGKTPQSITFNALPIKWVNDPAFLLSASATSGLAVTYASSNEAVATVAGNTVTLLTAGQTTLTASQIGNVTYDSATSVQQVLTVAPDAQTITFDALPAKAVDSLPFALTATTTSGLRVSYSSSNLSVATISDTTVTIVGAGTSTITASQSGNNQYAPAANKFQTLTVTKANQIITFDALTDKTLDSLPFALTATASSALTVSYASSNTNVATISGSTVTLTGAGTTTLTASQAGNANWNAAVNVPQTLTVGKGHQTITFGALADTAVGGPAVALTATATSDLTVTYASSDTSVAKIAGSFVTLRGVGTTTITASQAGNAHWNPATDVQQTLTLHKGSQTLTFGALADVAMGDAAFDLGATASSNLTVTYVSSDPLVASVSGKTVTINAPGTTTITASQAGDPNWNAAADVAQPLVVKRTQTITFALAPDHVTVGDPPFHLAATATSGLTVWFSSSDTGVATVSGVWVTIVGVGTAGIIAHQGGNSVWAEAPYDTQTLYVADTIDAQTITFDSLLAVSADDPPLKLTAWSTSGLTISYASSDTHVVKISHDTAFMIGVGTAIITASQPGEIHTYPAIPVARTLTVQPTVKVERNGKAIPDAFALLGGRPNPFNPSTTIPIAVPIALNGSHPVTLCVYDIRGRMVRTLLNHPMLPGYYNVTFDGRSDNGVPIGSGIYLCRMNAGVFKATRTIFMMK